MMTQTGRMVLICLLAAVTALAQNTEIEQLKNKMLQLDQTMQEIRKQILALEQAQKTPLPVTPAAPAPAKPVPIAQLPGTHYGEETRTRETAGQNEYSAARINSESFDPALKGFFRLPGTSTLMKFGGFVKTDIIYDLKHAGTFYGAYVPSSFPSSPTPHSKNATVSMRPSRFYWEARHGTLDNSGNTVKTYVEFDFFSNFDRNTLRLRQFYGQYKNVLVGQTWSAFSDPDAFPDTLEFEGPPGVIASRNPQVRYTKPLNEAHSIGASVEKSGVDTPFGTPFGTPMGTSNFPDLVGFYRYENKHGHLHAAALFRSVGGIIPNTTVPDLHRHTGGYGSSVSSTWGLGGKDSIVFQAVIGKGISNYYNDNFGLGTDVGFAADGHMVAVPTGSGTVGLTHNWTKMVRSTFSYGQMRINNTARAPGEEYHVSHYATANVIVQPTINFLFGGEYIYGSLERKNGFKWVAPRIQGSVTYYINKHPK
jgi:hypothetical protein